MHSKGKDIKKMGRWQDGRNIVIVQTRETTDVNQNYQRENGDRKSNLPTIMFDVKRSLEMSVQKNKCKSRKTLCCIKCFGKKMMQNRQGNCSSVCLVSVIFYLFIYFSQLIAAILDYPFERVNFFFLNHTSRPLLLLYFNLVFVLTFSRCEH